ncbi:MAG: DUF1634 domain-containing protein [Anaerolineae bacterium]
MAGDGGVREVQVPRGGSPNAMLSRLLSIGIGLALSLIALGLLLALFRPVQQSTVATPFAQLPAAVASGDPAAVVSLGLVVLLATPAARVVALAVAYAERREWTFALLAVIVLLVLVTSFLVGLSQ